MTAIQALVIGIGSGDPGQLTAEAVAAMNQVDVFLVADKGEAKHDLVALRAELCRGVIDHDHYRFVEVPDPERGPDRGRDARQYRAGVTAWHIARAAAYAEVISSELPHGGTVGFLVWGDPAFYDSTIRIVESVAATGVELDADRDPGHQQPATAGRPAQDHPEPDRRLDPRHHRAPAGRGVCPRAGRCGRDAGRRPGLLGPGRRPPGPADLLGRPARSPRRGRWSPDGSPK